MAISPKNYDIEKIEAIDVHAHLGNYRKEGTKYIEDWMSASAKEVIRLAQAANTKLTIFSHTEAILPPGQANLIPANRAASKITEDNEPLWFWVVLNPLDSDSFSQTRELITHPKCAGIKIHPEMHLYPIRQYGRKVFEFSAEFDAIVLTHSGESKSLPEDFLPFINSHPNVKLILAHLGWSNDNDPTHQVRTIEDSKHGNIYVDTSSSLSIVPNLIEWAVGRIGAERLLYGTDNPLYFAPMQRTRINYADINVSEKKEILFQNANKLISLTGKRLSL